MNETSGNMYPFVTHTWNPIRGECPHGCTYCFTRRWGKQPPLRLDEKVLNEDLGNGNFIFVASGTDMWANAVSSEWIQRALRQCKQYDNTYLFQSKNPERFRYWEFPEKTILGTTIETNRRYPCMGKAPEIDDRVRAMEELFTMSRVMVTIEPILDFDLDELVERISGIHPEWINIGADSKGHGLPEPSPEKVEALIEQLQVFTEVKIKDNLKRLRVKS